MNSIINIIDIFRRFIDETHHREDETNPLNEDLKKPGQEFEDGDIGVSFISLNEEQTEFHVSDIDISCFQRQLEKHGNLLLDMFNSNGIYLCEKNEMNEKVSKHMTQTGAYSLIEKLNHTNSNCIRQYLNQIVEQVTSFLNDLNERQCLNDIQVQQMNVERSKVQMDYLFFLPDPHQQGVPFQPVMICCLGATINIARFMNRLIQPIFDHVANSTTFFKGSDAVHSIEIYRKKGLLQSSTLFVNLHINDLCTIFPQEKSIRALERFLNEFVSDRQIQGVKIDTLIQLVRFVLKNQYFVFENKIYRQVKGCGSGSPLNQLLANIYMFYWQEDIVKILVNKNEIFGRCVDEVFMTWNGSKYELQSFIQKMINEKLPSLSLTTTIGKKINYLDVQISHTNGQLRTSINHDKDREPRTLPFISDHPPLMYSTLIQACLNRSTLVCSKVSDFQTERHDIEQTFLKNGYTMNYIDEHVEQFFREFDALEWKIHLNQNNYERLRQKVFDYDQQHTKMKIGQRKEEQIQHKWYLTSVLNGETLITFQKDFKRLWQHYVDNKPQFNDIKIEIIHRPKYPPNTK